MSNPSTATREEPPLATRASPRSAMKSAATETQRRRRSIRFKKPPVATEDLALHRLRLLPWSSGLAWRATSGGPLCAVPHSLSVRHLAHCLAGNRSSADAHAICSRVHRQAFLSVKLRNCWWTDSVDGGSIPFFDRIMEKQAVPLVFSQRHLIGPWLILIYF